MSEDKKEKFKIDFVGIGAERCATSWLFRCLEEHPEICMSKPKETHFFREHFYNKGIDYYKECFRHCSKKELKGEFSPEYFHIPKTIDRIKKHNPEVKLIISLRNPIQRTYSHYLLYRNTGRLAVLFSFEQALAQQKDIFVEPSMYYSHLKRVFRKFPKENILVLIYEDIKKDPLKFIQQVYRFLEVDPDFTPDALHQKVYKSRGVGIRSETLAKFVSLIQHFFRKRKNSILIKPLYLFLKESGIGPSILREIREVNKKLNVKKKSSKPIKLETRNYLKNLFRKDIQKLEKLIDRDLSFWR